MFDKFKVVNFSSLLLDYYKELNITNNELVILLMSEELLKDNNNLITNELLELKVNLTPNEIDTTLKNLMVKKYITYEMIGNDFVTSLKTIKDLLLSLYKRDLIANEMHENESENKEIIDGLIQTFENYFDKSLSTTEKEMISKWVDNGISEDMIIDSLKDAYTLNQLSIKKIDNIIAKKIKESDDEF